MAKESLGDGVFAEIDGRGLVLTTEHDGGITNTVVLKPEPGKPCAYSWRCAR